MSLESGRRSQYVPVPGYRPLWRRRAHFYLTLPLLEPVGYPRADSGPRESFTVTRELVSRNSRIWQQTDARMLKSSSSSRQEAYRARYGATAGLRTVVHPTETTVAPGPSREGSEGSDEGGDSELQHQSVSTEPLESSRGMDPRTERMDRVRQLLVEQQDRTLTDIAGTVGLLREQARVIGTEVFEQNSCVPDFGCRRVADSLPQRYERWPEQDARRFGSAG